MNILDLLIPLHKFAFEARRLATQCSDALNHLETEKKTIVQNINQISSSSDPPYLEPPSRNPFRLFQTRFNQEKFLTGSTLLNGSSKSFGNPSNTISKFLNPEK
ncbi:hypothetical protein ACOME3_008789 [Neoechinorhynchus agilis]